MRQDPLGSIIQEGVSKNRGTPKWMVYRENPIRMDDLGVPQICGNTHEYFSYILDCTIASTILFKFERLEDPEKWPDPKRMESANHIRTLLDSKGTTLPS